MHTSCHASAQSQSNDRSGEVTVRMKKVTNVRLIVCGIDVERLAAALWLERRLGLHSQVAFWCDVPDKERQAWIDRATRLAPELGQ